MHASLPRTQRILREYKNLSKRIIVTGNDRYIHIQTDARVSLHRSDNLFGVLDPKEDDVSIELSINTLSRSGVCAHSHGCGRRASSRSHSFTLGWILCVNPGSPSA